MFNNILTDLCKASRKAKFDASPQLSVGEFVLMLENLEDQKAWIFIDLGSMTGNPTEFDSFRGYYDELALGVNLDYGNYCTVEDLLLKAKAVIGKEFSGWKGGEYIMNKNTPLWVDNPGNCSNAMITGIKPRRWSGEGEIMWYLIEIKSSEGEDVN